MEESEAPATIRWHQGSPFQGLQAFDLEHAPVFYGRTRAIGEIKQALVDQEAKGCAFLLVFGMSGCGKSSLLRAGVLATLIRPGVVEGVGLWRWAIFRPSDTPQNLCQGLAAALFADKALPELAASGVAVADLGRMLAEAPQHALMPINMALHSAADEAARERQLTKSPEPRLLVLIDQLEEMFTLEKVDVGARQQFVAALAALARSGTVWVLASMRSDFYPRCAELPQLVALKESRGQYDLVPPSFDEIGQMISYPSRPPACGSRSIRRPASVWTLFCTKRPLAIARLCRCCRSCCAKLYEERTEDGCLTFAAYKSLKGLGGALARKAEDIFASLPAAAQSDMRPACCATGDRRTRNRHRGRSGRVAGSTGKLGRPPGFGRGLHRRTVAGHRSRPGRPTGRSRCSQSTVEPLAAPSMAGCATTAPTCEFATVLPTTPHAGTSKPRCRLAAAIRQAARRRRRTRTRRFSAHIAGASLH